MAGRSYDGIDSFWRREGIHMDQKEKFEYPLIDMKSTGMLLRDVCGQRFLSVKDIQQMLIISSNQAVYCWFNGNNMPSLNNFYAMSKLLKVPMESLIVEKGEDPELKMLCFRLLAECYHWKNHFCCMNRRLRQYADFLMDG